MKEVHTSEAMHLWDHTCPRCKKEMLGLATMMTCDTSEFNLFDIRTLESISLYCRSGTCEFNFVIAVNKEFGNVKQLSKDIEVSEK